MTIQAPINPIEPPRGGEIEQFSKTLETVYDCVLEPENWTVALHEINALTGADSSAFHWGDMQTRTVIETYHAGMSREFLEALRENSTYWIMQAGALDWKLGQVYHLPELMAREELENGRFYRNVLKPHRQLDNMSMSPAQDGSRLAGLSVNTSIDSGFFLPRAIELMRLLAPHITRAAKLSAAFDLKTLQASMLEKTLHSLFSGVLLIDRQEHVLFSNAAAQRMLEGHGGIRIAHGKLALKDAAAEESFKASLAALRDPAAAREQPPATIAVPGEAAPLILTLLPIASGRRKGLLAGFEATIAVFIQNMSHAPMMPGEALVKLYGFTPAETKVTMALMQGFSIADIADILGVAETTVRTHMKAIFAKTGTGRQAELVQLLMRAIAPVA